MREPIKESHEHIEQGLQSIENFTYYKGVGHFVKDYILEINKEQIQGDNFFIGSGARPLIPQLKVLKMLIILQMRLFLILLKNHKV